MYLIYSQRVLRVSLGHAHILPTPPRHPSLTPPLSRYYSYSWQRCPYQSPTLSCLRMSGGRGLLPSWVFYSSLGWKTFRCYQCHSQAATDIIRECSTIMSCIIYGARGGGRGLAIYLKRVDFSMWPIVSSTGTFVNRLSTSAGRNKSRKTFFINNFSLRAVFLIGYSTSVTSL